MDNLNINTTEGTKELIIRQGKAQEVRDPQVLTIVGTIETPFIWLQKRLSELNPKQCHILVDRKDMRIMLRINEKDHFCDSLTGALELHPVFLKFGINQGKYRTPVEMAEFIKMNRAHFENRQQAMELVSLLRSFKAKVDRQVEADFNPNKGDKKVLVAQVVDSNIPEKFTILIPLFKGGKKMAIEVETYFNPDDLTCTLVSPGANESIEDTRDSVIDDVISKITELCSEIPIIEI